MSTALLEHIHVGLVQTTLNNEIAWERSPRMCASEQTAACEEIKIAFRGLASATPKPDFVLMPELSCPRGFLDDVVAFARQLGSVVIAGLDYDIRPGQVVENGAAVIIPSNWQGRYAPGGARVLHISKVDPAPEENRKLQKAGWQFASQPNLWLFDADNAGMIGVTICSDLLDLERAMLYRGRIDHLFVLAYNRDARTFRYIAESLSRTIYCNVVVCNTGFFGGSVAIAPYYQDWDRVVYRHEGKGLLSYQVVTLPVRRLRARKTGTIDGKDPKFKDVPSTLTQVLRLRDESRNVT